MFSGNHDIRSIFIPRDSVRDDLNHIQTMHQSNHQNNPYNSKEANYRHSASLLNSNSQVNPQTASHVSGNRKHQTVTIEETMNDGQDIDIVMTKVYEGGNNNSDKSIKDNMSLNSPKLTSNSSNAKSKNNDKSTKMFLSD